MAALKCPHCGAVKFESSSCHECRKLGMVPDPDVVGFWNAQADWSQATFGSDQERGPIGPLKHLEKEAVEAYTETDADKQRQEIIDCQFLTFDAARRSGMTIQELFARAFDKLEIKALCGQLHMACLPILAFAVKACDNRRVFSRSGTLPKDIPDPTTAKATTGRTTAS